MYRPVLTAGIAGISMRGRVRASSRVIVLHHSSLPVLPLRMRMVIGYFSGEKSWHAIGFIVFLGVGSRG